MVSVGPPPLKFDNEGPPDIPPDIPPIEPTGSAKWLVSGFSSVSFSTASGFIPAFFIFFLSSSLAISSGEIVLNFGLESEFEDDFVDEAAFNSACLAASSFAAFSFST